MPLWTYLCKFCVDMFSFLYVFRSRTGMLEKHMVTQCLTFWATTKLFSRVAALFHILPSSTQGPNVFTPSPMLCTACLSCYSHPVGVKWGCTVVLICIFPDNWQCWAAFHGFTESPLLHNLQSRLWFCRWETQSHFSVQQFIECLS